MNDSRLGTVRLLQDEPVVSSLQGRAIRRNRLGTTRLGWAVPVSVGGPTPSLPPDFLTAVWEALSAEASLEAAFGRPAGGVGGWLQWPDGQSELPLAVLSSIDLGVQGRTFVDLTLRTVRLVVSVYATPESSARSLGQAIRSALAPVNGYQRVHYSDGAVDGKEIPGGRTDRTFPSGPESLPDRDRRGRAVFLEKVLFDYQLREYHS